MDSDLIWMDLDTGTWGGCAKDGMIIVQRAMLSDEDREALENDPTEGEVYQILMKYVRLSKHSRIITLG